MKILIKNGRVLDPATNTDEVMDLLTIDEKIAARGSDIYDGDDCTVINAKGCYVMPGLIDLHVHLRDPGLEYKETIATGGRAAARGGFTTIVAMANTKPVIDTPEKLAKVQERAAVESPIHVLQTGSLTIGMAGEELADIEGMAEAGAYAISEDGKTVMNAQLFREAAAVAAKTGIPILDHCEDSNMKSNGVMNDCEKAVELGVKGISNAVEDVIIARDILIAKELGAPLHICHCSTADSVKMIQLAKEEGCKVTGEVCPHHFTLTSDEIPGHDSNYKMAPPLRARKDVEALKKGLKDGIMDVISTDHAPHAAEEKSSDMASAAFGIVGLETAVALTVSELVMPGILTPMQMAEKMSYNPSNILGLGKGSLEVGKVADITIINPNAEYVIDKEEFVSKGRNTPFDGRKVKGKVMTTICDGTIVFKEKNAYV
ncbi:MAG: dihydroorotase [Hespellia sp.]|nr:dihydroorotase [Hespellia sp.]